MMVIMKKMKNIIDIPKVVKRKVILKKGNIIKQHRIILSKK